MIAGRNLIVCIILSFLASTYLIVVTNMKSDVDLLGGHGNTGKPRTVTFQNASKAKFSATYQPFVPNQPKTVVILAYQRTGSTLLGQMFNSNPTSVFYMFEPLDAVYSAMYGTSMGWNVPSDITNHHNGSLRTLPEREIRVVSDTLRSILNCDVDSLPTHLLASGFLDVFRHETHALSPYIACITNLNITKDRCDPAKAPTDGFCGGRFGETNEDRLSKCYELFWKQNLQVDDSRAEEIRRDVSKFHVCMQKLRSEIDTRCSALFLSSCAERRVRVTKTVRATMSSMEPLLRDLPNFRVIHLMRDPRGVIVSRKNFHESVRGMYSESAKDTSAQLAKEAKLYCQTVMRDVEERKRLESLYPGRTFQVVYDDFVTDIPTYTKHIHRFLDMEVPRSTRYWARDAKIVASGKSATELAFAWKDTITHRNNKDIVAQCRDLFQLLRLSSDV